MTYVRINGLSSSVMKKLEMGQKFTLEVWGNALFP